MEYKDSLPNTGPLTKKKYIESLPIKGNEEEKMALHCQQGHQTRHIHDQSHDHVHIEETNPHNHEHH